MKILDKTLNYVKSITAQIISNAGSGHTGASLGVSAIMLALFKDHYNFDVSDTKNSEGEKVIPKGKYLVLGDNRLNSNDSHQDVGLITDKQIVGKAKLRILPTNNMKYDFYADSFDHVNEN